MTYRIGVDIGGTFTDCVVLDADGVRTPSKALTTPDGLEQGVLDALAVNAASRGLSLRELLEQTELFLHGTTQATNDLLLRRGARTGLITTIGHEDAIIIGRVYSKMAGLAERDLVRSSRLRKPDPVVPRALIRGVPERIDRDGDVLVELDEDAAAQAVDELVVAGVEAIAVCLLWSFVNDAHERRIGEIIGERAPHVFTCLSHEIAPRMGEYERAATTAINAYVGPRVVSYLNVLEDRLREAGLCTPLLVMQASGGLTSVADAARRPIVTLDSGPTGGILGCQHLARQYGEPNVICTDVGGTSFDVGLILDGEVPLDAEPVVGQYSLRFPKVLVRSIGSGGGSIAWLDAQGLLHVGPQSAGSNPGPVCYGRGGTQPTVTDADLVLGHLSPDTFLGGRMRLDRDAALRALAELGRPLGMEAEEVAAGVARIINAQMADLIRTSTIERGYDPRDCVMVAYGGAGPTHAVAYGQDIGARAIIVPAISTVFSAAGILTCDITHTAEMSRRVVSPYDQDDLAAVGERFAVLEQRVLDQFAAEGMDGADITLRRIIGIRFRQQVHTLEVPVDPGPLDSSAGERIVERFIDAYARTFGAGALPSSRDTELELHRVVGTRRIEPVTPRAAAPDNPDPEHARKGERTAWFEPDGFIVAAVYDGAALRCGNVVTGPALIERMGDCVVLPPGYEAAVDQYLSLWIRPTGTVAAEALATTSTARSA